MPRLEIAVSWLSSEVSWFFQGVSTFWRLLDDFGDGGADVESRTAGWRPETQSDCAHRILHRKADAAHEPTPLEAGLKSSQGCRRHSLKQRGAPTGRPSLVIGISAYLITPPQRPRLFKPPVAGDPGYCSSLVTSCCTLLACARAEMPVWLRISYFDMLEDADA